MVKRKRALLAVFTVAPRVRWNNQKGVPDYAYDNRLTPMSDFNHIMVYPCGLAARGRGNVA